MGSRVALVFLMGMLLISPLLATKSFDFYYLVLMWPGAYCVQTSSGCCLPTTGLPSSDFYLKGLIPYSLATGAEVTKCQKDSFSINDLSDQIKEELYEYWPNIQCPSNNGRNSWKSTWKNYGVCSTLTPAEYFETVLAVGKKVNVLADLAKHSITPSYDVYEVDAIESAIAEGIGAKPIIRCSKGPFDEFQLYEVYICVAKDGSTIIECPLNPGFTCSAEILFHPFKPWMLKQTPADSTVRNFAELPVIDHEDV